MTNHGGAFADLVSRTVRRRWFRIAAASVLLVVAACASAPAIDSGWISSDGMHLEVAVDTCGADLTVEVRYGTRDVALFVNAENDHRENDCMDGLDITLEQPLAGRRLIDASTGNEINVLVDDSL